MTEKKNYIKSFIKEVTFANGGSVINCSLNFSDVAELPVDEYGNIRLTIAKSKEEGKYGQTHYAYENTYKPTKQEEKQDLSKRESLEDNINIDDLPF